LANQNAQNYTATAITYTISGNAGVAGATLSYTDGSTTAGAGGNYTITAPYNWSGTVMPSKTGYTFTPTSRTYANLLANQIAQNYTAAVFPPEIIRLDPAGGTQACPRPAIGVDLLVSEWTRNLNGAFDLSKVTLTLDSSNVTNAATVWELLVYPSVHVTILYTPTADLALGLHQTEFTYLTESGPSTLKWSFTAANIACATTLDGQPEAGGTAVSQAAPGEPLAAPSEPASAATIGVIISPTRPAAVAPLAQPTQSPVTRVRNFRAYRAGQHLLIPR
jgi:hypothetical protein